MRKTLNAMNKKLTTFVVLPVALAAIATIFVLIAFWIDDVKIKDYSTVIYRLDDTTRERMHLDSLNALKVTKETELKNVSEKIYEFTTGFLPHGLPNAGFIGLMNIRMFTPISKERADSVDDSKKYLLLGYLGLNIHRRNDRFDRYIFHTHNDSVYISELTEVKPAPKDVRLFRYSKFKSVGYLYLPAQSARTDSKDGIAILIKSNFWRMAYNVFFWFTLLLGLYTIAVTVSNSLVILFNISRNRVFDSFNIFRLKWMAIACFIVLLFPYLFTLICYSIYFKDFYPDVSFTHSFRDSDYKWCIAGVVYLLLFFAFRKGYKLQQEQDLTI